MFPESLSKGESDRHKHVLGTIWDSKINIWFHSFRSSESSAASCEGASFCFSGFLFVCLFFLLQVTLLTRFINGNLGNVFSVMLNNM